MGDYEDFQAKQVLEFLVLIQYPEKPTRVIVTVGNTLFGALLGDKLVYWGLLLSDIVGRMVGLVSKGKSTMVCPYMFHLYKEHQVLLSSKLTFYTLRMEMIKYNCTLDPEPTLIASKSRLEPPQPTPTVERRRKQKTSTNKRADSTPTMEILSKDARPSTSEVEKNARAFDNAISWIEVARENFNALGQVVKDVAQALDIIDIRDFDKALETIPKPRDLAERDN